MTRTRRQRHLIVSLTEVAREGRRYYAFYQGYQAHRSGGGANPFKPGSEEHTCWQRGWQYGAEEAGS